MSLHYKNIELVNIKSLSKHVFSLRGQGEGGSLGENLLEIDFIAVSDRGDKSGIYQLLWIPSKNIVPSRGYCWSNDSTVIFRYKFIGITIFSVNNYTRKG